MKEGFYPIPGFSNYACNENGDVLNIEKNTLNSWHKSNGYVFTLVYKDNGKRYCLGQHRALALTFLKKPKVAKGVRLTVNHKDGVKDHNWLDNLEWARYGENTTHAYETRLRPDSLPVDVVNLKTGEQHRYFSLSEFHRQTGINRDSLKRVDGKCVDVVIGDLDIKFDYSDYKYFTGSYDYDVVARNIVTGLIYIESTCAQLSKLINVCPKVIRRVVEGKRFTYPIKGWDIRPMTKKITWPWYTEDEKRAFSIETFIYKPLTVVYPDGHTELYGNIRTASETLGITDRSIRDYLKHNKTDKHGRLFCLHTCEISNSSKRSLPK